MQAVYQKHTDLAVSKTINMANDAEREDVQQAYRMAYGSNCIGNTIYRDGSKPTQVLEVQSDKSEQLAETPVLTKLVVRPRPTQMRGVTERVRTGHGNMFVTINFDEEGRPFEVFSTLGKAGGYESAAMEAISRLISLALRSGIDSNDIVDQLKGITSTPPGTRASSWDPPPTPWRWRWNVTSPAPSAVRVVSPTPPNFKWRPQGCPSPRRSMGTACICQTTPPGARSATG